jgi:hypothetical protein
VNARILLTLSAAAALALPLHAQFAITVQQNGQAGSEANGGSIVMNAPSLTQSASATVVVTYTGNNTAVFPSSGEIFGATNFTVTGSDTSSSLKPFASATFVLNYAPSATSQATAEFLWPFTETATDNTGPSPVTTTVNSGVITFNLVGTSPNLTVGQATSSGSFQTIASGGTFQFPNTPVNTASTITVGINNAGSGPGTVNSITATGTGYTLTGVPLLPLTIAAGAQLNFTIQFQPTSAASATGSLQIAFANGNYAATLAGTGITSFLSYNVTQGATTSPLTPGQAIAMGAINVGTPSTAIVQFQNMGATAYVLSTVAVSGTGFAITDGPFLPVTIQPQQSNSITITYTPTLAGPSAGRLLIGSDSFALSGQGPGSTLTFAYQAGSGATTPVAAGGTITFSPVIDGQSASLQFTVTNAGTTAATLSSIGVVDTTGVFGLSNLPALPLQLNPAAAVSFTISFSPVSSGISSATLAINNQAFGLTGFPATPPPLPSYTFTGASGTQQPFQQPAIGLSLATPYSSQLYGTLTISDALSGFSADPAVQFSSGGVQVAFTIPANTLKAVFPNGATQIQLQTGTVAGVIQVTPAFTVGTATGTNVTPTNPTTLTLTVPSLAPTLLTAAIGSQSTTSLSIIVTGFSDSRSLDHLNFQLTPASGFTLGTASFSVDVSAAATLWFQSSTSQSEGGQFTVQIPFTFAESSVAAGTNLSAAISAVSVSAVNSVGTSNVLTVTVP